MSTYTAFSDSAVGHLKDVRSTIKVLKQRNTEKKQVICVAWKMLEEIEQCCRIRVQGVMINALR